MIQNSYVQVVMVSSPMMELKVEQDGAHAVLILMMHSQLQLRQNHKML